MHQERQSGRKHRFRAGILIAALGLLGAIAWKEGGSEKLLFVSNRAGEKMFNIYTMNPDGSGVTQLTKGETIDVDPAFSPDGKQIVFACISDIKEKKCDICLMKADGTGRKVLAKSDEKVMALSPVWSPDGKKIAYTTFQPGEGDPLGSMHFYVMNADGTDRKDMGEGLLPAWSPNGKQMLFSAKAAGGGDVPTLKIMDVDGKNAKVLADRGAMASWSPDGKKIVYLNEGGGGQADIFVMDADGTHEKQLTSTQNDMEFGPTWSSDGKHIYFTRSPKDAGDKPTMQAYVMDADGSNIKPLTKGDSANLIGTGAALFFIVRSHASN